MPINLKDFVSDFINHVNNMTDEEVLVSIDKAQKLVVSEYRDEFANHGCEYCSRDGEEYQSTSYIKLSMDTVLGEKVLVADCNPCPPYAECCMKEVPVRSVFKINYCPNCGAKMDRGKQDG